MTVGRWLLWAVIGLGSAGPSVLAAGNPGAGLLYPVDGASSVDLTQPFRLTAVASAQSYCLVIGTAPGKADVWGSGETTATSMLVPQNLPRGKTLYARVWTKVQGTIRRSADVSFTVGGSASPKAAAFANGRYPILWEGQEITVPGAVVRISFFSPVFGAERLVVNPVVPRVVRNRIVFRKAGEYYLTFNGTSSLKVLVLGVNEPISAAVTRLFDFWVANCVFAANGDADFYADQAGYLDGFFRSTGPMVNLCGPTHATLARVIADVFALPTRRPTFPGTFRWEGDIYYATHNPVEVYLPDLDKWVLFDVNYAFTVRWMSAQELCTFIRANASPKDTGYPEVSAFQTLDIHDAPRTYLANDSAQGSQQRVSRLPVQYVWKEIFRFYYGGVAYWGGEAYFQMPHGTEFLPGMYVWASLHTDPALVAAAINWIESFGIPGTIVSPGTLDALLEDGHRPVILQAAWKDKIPPSVLVAVAHLAVPTQGAFGPVSRWNGR